MKSKIEHRKISSSKAREIIYRVIKNDLWKFEPISSILVSIARSLYIDFLTVPVVHETLYRGQSSRWITMLKGEQVLSLLIKREE